MGRGASTYREIKNAPLTVVGASSDGGGDGGGDGDGGWCCSDGWGGGWSDAGLEDDDAAEEMEE